MSVFIHHIFNINFSLPAFVCHLRLIYYKTLGAGDFFIWSTSSCVSCTKGSIQIKVIMIIEVIFILNQHTDRLLQSLSRFLQAWAPGARVFWHVSFHSTCVLLEFDGTNTVLEHHHLFLKPFFLHQGRLRQDEKDAKVDFFSLIGFTGGGETFVLCFLDQKMKAVWSPWVHCQHLLWLTAANNKEMWLLLLRWNHAKTQ